MKKIFIAAIFLTAIFIGTACAEEESYSPADAPEEINHADSIYYKHPDFYNMTSTDDRIILPYYPTYQQTTEYSYGPAAALTVLKYFGREDFDEATLIKLMKTKPEIGTTLGNMVKFFKSIGSFDRFFSMWFDHNMLPEAERNQPWLIAFPKK